MREKLQTAESEREELRVARKREEILTRQIKQLSEQLVEARRHHTPVNHTHTHTHTHTLPRRCTTSHLY